MDPFNGLQDIQNKTLRATSEHFSEDSLRVLRGFQFAGRFDMQVESKTAATCRSILPDAKHLAKERIREEVVKWATKSRVPSAGIRFLVDTGWIELFPELQALQGCLQDPEWHPEGDAFEHTLLVCDAAAEIADREKLAFDDRLVLMLSALCHDLGKATTTVIEGSRIKSPGHAGETGLTVSLLERMGFEKAIIDKVVPLVQEHMVHIGVEPTQKFVRRLSLRLVPANINLLVLLIEADHSGRPPLPKVCPDSAKRILEISAELKIQSDVPKPLVMGRHLIECGLTPGPQFSELLKLAYAKQIDGEFETIEDGLKLIGVEN